MLEVQAFAYIHIFSAANTNKISLFLIKKLFSFAAYGSMYLYICLYKHNIKIFISNLQKI